MNKCGYCEKPTENPKYCSLSHQAAHTRQKSRERWLRGERLDKWTIKNFIVEDRGNKCEICGVSEWQNKKLVMVLDHRNGNSKDNTSQNLRLLCPNCDSQTDTFKGKNRGQGRYARSKRYRDGLSY